MSILRKPDGDKVAASYGNGYLDSKQLSKISVGQRFEVLCSDELHYRVEVKEFDTSTKEGLLHFCRWSTKHDYRGSFESVYIAPDQLYSKGLLSAHNNYPTENMRNQTNGLSSSAVKKRKVPSTDFLESTRYPDDFLNKPRLFSYKKRGSSRKIEDDAVLEGEAAMPTQLVPQHALLASFFPTQSEAPADIEEEEEEEIEQLETSEVLLPTSSRYATPSPDGRSSHAITSSAVETAEDVPIVEVAPESAVDVPTIPPSPSPAIRAAEQEESVAVPEAAETGDGGAHQLLQHSSPMPAPASAVPATPAATVAAPSLSRKQSQWLQQCVLQLEQSMASSQTLIGALAPTSTSTSTEIAADCLLSLENARKLLEVRLNIDHMLQLILAQHLAPHNALDM
jgi:hypothetical protein